MSDDTRRFTGGCLCGAVRYEATGAPNFQGICFCGDCRKASGSSSILFMGFPASALRFSGETKHSLAKSARGTTAVRNHCVKCGSLVFGGIVGQDTAHTIYAGSLDDFTLFRPAMAIFVRDKPEWFALPPGVTAHHTMPGMS